MEEWLVLTELCLLHLLSSKHQWYFVLCMGMPSISKVYFCEKSLNCLHLHSTFSLLAIRLDHPRIDA